MSRVKVKVWTGRRTVIVCGILSKFPSPLKAKGTKNARYKRVQILHARAQWFLYYGNDHPTGGFRSRTKAVSWFMNGGR